MVFLDFLDEFIFVQMVDVDWLAALLEHLLLFLALSATGALRSGENEDQKLTQNKQ